VKKIILLFQFSFCALLLAAQPRAVIPFNKDWKFFLGDDTTARSAVYNDSKWRVLQLPHDWSIEGEFSDKHPTTYHQGALPAGIGWYRKTFRLPQTEKGKMVYINFDGVYRNSEVWINGHSLGKRPNGYSSFRYDLTPFLKKWPTKNTIAVRVDNSAQPSSRWYTGSGIYRKVWLETTTSLAVDHWGSFVSTPTVDREETLINVQTRFLNTSGRDQRADLVYEIYDVAGRLVKRDASTGNFLLGKGSTNYTAAISLPKPQLWSVDSPYLYKAVTKVIQKGKLLDRYETTFGIRTFRFDAKTGFYLNEKPLKILGVCQHHDMGALGTAVNIRAIERQLEVLKAMGCNAIRTAHNPPAQELLELCDNMGFLVMDEAFDMWQKRKNKFDYHLEFADWHKQDLEAMIKRDRNHPSVFMWSIGNEIREQFDSTGLSITKELVQIVKQHDPTRPVTSALTENVPEKNFIYRSGALDYIGFNYKHADYPSLPGRFPGQSFLATETASALATRGHYEFPSDSTRIWPRDSKSKDHGNPEHTASAYDNTYAYWGATHEESWKAVKKAPYMAGIFVWSGFDFLGEPVPYEWPSRSSYYGIIDLAGFPKDVYYLYQSEWTTKPVLHIFPHWNWEKGQDVDVWAYYNNADEVELFVNGVSQGVRKKAGDSLHVMWRVRYSPGLLKAVSRKEGRTVLQKEIKTAGSPARIQLTADRKKLAAEKNDLSFITVKLLDADGTPVPDADNKIRFTVKGPAFLAGVDNGNPVSMESFKSNEQKLFNGLCLAIVQTNGKKGVITLEARTEGLPPVTLQLQAE
jgi:beta-galactosidase